MSIEKALLPLLTRFALLALLLTGVGQSGAAQAQVPHLLNYQGYLTTPGTGTPVTATVPMLLKLYTVASGGTALYTETQSVTVTNGVFDVAIGSVTPLNLPFDVQYYLGITVATDQEMTPRQLVTASPYTLHAAIADALAPAATVGGAQITGSISSATLPAANLNGTLGTAQIADHAVTQAKLSPSTGAAPGKVLGTDGTNLQWQPASGGGTVTSVGTGTGLSGGPITAAGTINLTTTQLLPTVTCAINQIPKWNGTAWACAADNDTNNTANDTRYFKQGGNAFGVTTALGTTDANPLQLLVNGASALRLEPNATSPNHVAGYSGNSVTAGVVGASIGGGGSPINSCGPASNSSCQNQVTDDFGMVGGGVSNVAGDGMGTTSDADWATVGGGKNNRASGAGSTIGGGVSNTASGLNSTVSGGDGNTAGGYYATVSGGLSNSASGSDSVVPGGNLNTAAGAASFAAGNWANADQDQCFVFANWSTVPNSRMSCLGSKYIARFGLDHGLSIDYHSARSDGGGTRWVAIGDTITGQTIGTWTGAFLSDLGNWINVGASGQDATVGGGLGNTAGGNVATVGGGNNNHASAGSASVGGGNDNTASNLAATVPGGSGNTASGPGSFAAGRDASATHAGSFVWGSGVGPASSNADNRFGVRADGGVEFFISTGSCLFLPGNTGWNCSSDRALKENFAAIDVRAVLERALAMPVTQWNFKGHPEQLHIGPVAQDFQAAFGLGNPLDATHIDAGDSQGVALAAIQGLNAKLDELAAAFQRQLDAKDAKIDAQAVRIAELEHDRSAQTARLDALEKQATDLAMLKQQMAQMAQLRQQVSALATAR